MIGRRARKVVAAVAAVAAGLCLAAGPAGAEVGAPGASVQAIAADAQFLEYAPPPAAPGVVCLIDSGVDPNPDTTPILAGSYALQPGTDTKDELSKINPPVEPGNHPDGHGTYMAMIMAAPVNGWGMVGIAPTSVRVFNVKALASGQGVFLFGTYGYAINHCIDGPAGVSGVSVINLSLGSATQPAPSDLADFEDTVGAARVQGLSVVAAAGNDGLAVRYPAAASGVLGVGATDANPTSSGVFCSFSDRGSALSVLAPGCGTQSEADGGGNGVDVAFSDDGSPAWAYGTSEASAVVSAVLASLRAYGPGLTAKQAEGCLSSTLRNGGNLDAAAAFRACGLSGVVDQGMAAYASAAALPPTVGRPSPTVASPPLEAVNVPRLPPPMVPWTACPRVTGVRFRRGVLVVTVGMLPSGTRLRVDAERNHGRHFQTVASATVDGRSAALRVSRWDRLAVLLLAPGKRSAVMYLRHTAVTRGGRTTVAPRCPGSD